ncbi:hypothetical protein LJK88_15950 [Paenibacillus sp. P26]|nr:hypothetical protein LJK88_15950 [Paenibacillus sp. P26]
MNVRVRALVGFVKDLTRYDAGFIRLLAPGLRPFEENGPLADRAASEQTHNGKRIQSDYTGWLYVSGGQRDERLSLASLFGGVWMIVGAAAIVLGLIWFTWITHRHYKPIQTIAGRISDYSKRKSGELVRHAGGDELKFIENAIDELLDRTSRYERLHEDDLLIRRRQVLVDWLEGRKTMDEAEWNREMARPQSPAPSTGCRRR